MRRLDRFRHLLKLRDLHVLMTVAQARSMNKAAALLNTTQPSVTRSIRDLERILGVSLFNRGPRGVELTPYGRVLLDGGSAIFDDLRQITKNMEFLNDPTMGCVRLGCSPLLAANFVAAVVDHVSRRYPLIEFEIMPAPIEMGYRQLIERKVDLLITRKVGPVNDEQLLFEPLFDDFLVVVSGAGHPCARRRNIRLSELADELWVLTPSDYVLGADVLEAFRRSGIDRPRATVTTSAQDVRLSLVATGRFLTIFPASALKYPPKQQQEIRVLPVELPIASVPNGMVTLKKRMSNPVVQLVMEHTREVASTFGQSERRR